MSDIMKLIEGNRKLETEIFALEKAIEEKKLAIKCNNRIIFKECKHKWEYDTSCGPYEHIKYQCTICGLWRNNYMYL